jgi:hypothetical protein
MGTRAEMKLPTKIPGSGPHEQGNERVKIDCPHRSVAKPSDQPQGDRVCNIGTNESAL